MPSYYTYFISSLPMLYFGAKSPLSSERFFNMCENVISESDIDILKRSCSLEDTCGDVHPTWKKWRAFDIALRNELVKIRAARKHKDPLKYMRQDGYTDPSIAHIAIHAHRAPSIIEAERILDEERWRMLDELSAGHHFDIDFLIVYANKLAILERWDRINSADTSSELEKVEAV